MKEGGAGELRAEFLNAFSWVFTVGGGIVALVLAKESWWISVLTVLAVAIALAAFTYRTHRRLRQAEALHQQELQAAKDESRAALDTLRAERQELTQRLADAERKINEVPLDILRRLEGVIATNALDEVVRQLTVHADWIERLKAATTASEKPLTLRTFTKQDGALYVAAKVVSQATVLKVGDPFILTKKGAGGLETPIARLLVSQPPSTGREPTVFLRIERSLTEEVAAIEKLADHGDIAKIGGYSLHPACNLGTVAGLEWGSLRSPLLPQLAADLLRNRGS